MSLVWYLAGVASGAVGIVTLLVVGLLNPPSWPADHGDDDGSPG